MENKFEKVLWSVRYVVILAVILSIVASISLIVIGSWDIIQAIIFYNPLFDSAIQDNNQLLFKIISSIDLFLIGIVLLIFGFGKFMEIRQDNKKAQTIKKAKCHQCAIKEAQRENSELSKMPPFLG